MTTEEFESLEKEIAALEAEGKKISISNKIKLKKLQKKRDKLNSPVEPSSVFVSESNIKDSVRLIDINKIQMPNFNDRTGIDDKKIQELAESIKKNGLLQPIVLQENSDGSFTKISGRRRILATKLNGENRIEAILKKDDLTKRQFNLLVLHENTQREDLSVYDKVRFILNFIEQEFNIDQSSAVKICHKINNYKKGNLTQEDQQLKKEAEILDQILIDTKVFSSIATFVRHLPILDMDLKVLEYLDANKITFNMAVLFNQYKNKKFIENREFDTIIQEVVIKEMSINEAKKYFQSLVYREEKKNQNDSIKKVKSKISKLNKIALNLESEKLQNLENALENLIDNYQ